MPLPEKDEKSAAFVNGYKHDLQDPAEHDFAYLAADDMSEESDDVGEDSDNDDRPARQKVSVAQLREELLTMAKSDEVSSSKAPNRKRINALYAETGHL